MQKHIPEEENDSIQIGGSAKISIKSSNTWVTKIRGEDEERMGVISYSKRRFSGSKKPRMDWLKFGDSNTRFFISPHLSLEGEIKLKLYKMIRTKRLQAKGSSKR